MIEIIRHGNKMQIECKNCGALLRYQYEDIKENSWGHNVTPHIWKRYIICPDCKSEVITEQSK